LRDAENELVEHVRGITYSAHAMGPLLARDHPRQKRYLVLNAISTSFFRDVESSIHQQEQRRPVIGYIGFLDPRWADRQLLLKVAEHFPECSIVIRSSMDRAFAKRLSKFPNVTIVGFQSREELIRLLTTFSVGIIPFLNNSITDVINPLKLYEYCAAGIPVVATATPELEHYREIVSLSYSHEEFLSNIKNALGEMDGAQKAMRKSFAAQNTWESRADQLLHIIAEHNDLN
jgi:hypothetical protein